MKRLLVVISDRLSEIVFKGEITRRYYNPGDLFDEVHILMTNDDKVDANLVQPMVGRASLFLYNVPLPSFISTLGWQFPFLKNWVATAINLAQTIKPNLIRAYGNFQNGYLAARIKKAMHIPLAVSLHINPDKDLRGRTSWRNNWKKRLAWQAFVKFEKETLKAADIVLPVYKSIYGYAVKRGARLVEVCYNVINPVFLAKKTDYSLHTPPRIISVGRQFEAKNPVNIIRSLALLPDVELTLVGDGPYHSYLQETARQAGVASRVIFHKAIPNDHLCQMLPDYDIFATHSDYWEISKSVLEALLTGLPVVLNHLAGQPVPELQGDFVMLVKNTVTGYYEGISRLLIDHSFREQMGHKAYAHSQTMWSPAQTESKYVEIYESLLNGTIL